MTAHYTQNHPQRPHKAQKMKKQQRGPVGPRVPRPEEEDPKVGGGLSLLGPRGAGWISQGGCEGEKVCVSNSVVLTHSRLLYLVISSLFN